jgi:hypothetical protein
MTEQRRLTDLWIRAVAGSATLLDCSAIAVTDCIAKLVDRGLEPGDAMITPHRKKGARLRTVRATLTAKGLLKVARTHCEQPIKMTGTNE